MEEKKQVQLPENAFRELKEGEEYEPVMSPRKEYPEVNVWSVTWGILMAVLFSAAAAYLGLKVGQVFEAAIPIAIIAVGVSAAAKRSKALGENVIIQSIGACSGSVVAGAIFTLPAIYILQAKYPEVFRKGHARKIPFPRSNSHHTSSYLWRERRFSSKTPAHRGYRGWSLRFHCCHFRLVE